MISKTLPPVFTHKPGCIPWKAGVPLARVHNRSRVAVEFKPAGKGNPGRFDPMYDPPSVGIGTMYCGQSELCALGETVFRIQNSGSYQQSISLDSLGDQQMSELVPQRDLSLIALCGPQLHAYDLEPAHLQGGPSTYAWIRQFAAQLHDAERTADGVVWMSRQCNTEQAMVLWEDRVNVGTFKVTPGSTCLLTVQPALDHVARFASLAGVQLY